MLGLDCGEYSIPDRSVRTWILAAELGKPYWTGPAPTHHAIRSRLTVKDQATIITELATKVKVLLQSGQSISENLVNLLENGELLYEGAAASVMLFKLSENIPVAVKVTSKESATTEQQSLLYLRENSPTFPAPRQHGLVSLGISYLLFTTFIPVRGLEKVWPQLNDSEKQVISDQLESLFLQLRSLSYPDNTPLGDIGREGCKDLRRVPRLDFFSAFMFYKHY